MTLHVELKQIGILPFAGYSKGKVLKMDALIFDFDGVVVDTERFHFLGFVAVLADKGVNLTEDLYLERYSGFDDRDGFNEILSDNDIEIVPGLIEQLTEEKTQVVCKMIEESVISIPGVVEMIHSARDAGLPMAICSGALKNEIEIAATTIGVRDCFEIIVAAEDVPKGKPDPEGYYKARRLLAENRKQVIDPSRCVVCEDTPAGILAAKGAGMKVCALTTTHGVDRLEGADMVVGDFTEILLKDLKSLVE